VQESSLLNDVARLTIPSLVVCLGWFVANFLTVKRETRNTRRSMIVQEIESITKDLASLTKLVIGYHCAERNRRLEGEINTGIQDLTQRVTRISKMLINVDRALEIIKRANDFKKAATLVHFEDDHTKRLDSSCELIQNITATSFRLREGMSDAKFDQVKD
jgi:hypothetical protein